MRIFLLAFALVLIRAEPVLAHCDALDGPVVAAAREALRTGDFALIVVWVKRTDERALRSAFQRTVAVRGLGPEARELADTYFFETAVRLHRQGEGEPFTGLKSAGRDYGPALPAAERALATDNANALIELVVAQVRTGLRERFLDANAREIYRRGDVEAGRAYVASYTDFIHYALGVWAASTVSPVHIEEPERHER